MNATLVGNFGRGNIVLSWPGRAVVTLVFGLLLAALVPATQTLPAAAQSQASCAWPTGWSRLAVPEPDAKQLNTQPVAVAPGWEHPGQLWLIVNDGLYSTRDCAASWQLAASRDALGAQAAQVATGRGGIVYIRPYNSLLTVSSDGGKSWSKSTYAEPTTRYGSSQSYYPLAFANSFPQVAPSDSSVAYASIQSPNPGAPAFTSGAGRTTDGGRTWAYPSGSSGLVVAGVDPDDSSVVFAVDDVTVLRSRNGGVTFEPVAQLRESNGRPMTDIT